MSTTITKLRAVVEAQTAAAQAEIRQFGATVSQTSDTAAQGLGRVSAVLKGDFSGALLGLGATAAVVGAGVAIAKVAVSMDDMRQRAANVRKELTAYAGSATNANAATEAMLRATEGGISRLDAMANASKLMSMGLATTSDQVYQLSRMAVMLGDKTMNVTDRMASFNAMLANQSIERLDTFGISSGRVRERIEELQAAMPGLSREQAFVNAVLEIGAGKLEDVEAAGVTATTSMERITAAMGNLKQATADLVNVSSGADALARFLDTMAEGMATFSNPLTPLSNARTEAIDAWNKASDERVRAEAALEEARTSAKYALTRNASVAYYQEQLDTAMAAEAQAAAEYDVAQAAYDAAAGQQAATTAAAALGSIASGVTSDLDGMTSSLIRNTTWLEEFKAAADAVNAIEATKSATRARLNEHIGVTERMAGGGTLPPPAPLRGSKAWNDIQAAEIRMAELRAMIAEQEAARLAAARGTNTGIADDWQRRMEQAGDEAANSYRSEMQKGMNFSIGLNDLRPGGNQGPNAPGQNGAFEDIYRLQAFVSGGTWGETAAKYGLDKESATKRIQDFQSGKWTPEVMQLIDKDKLTQQIQDAQLGESMMNAVAADLAKASGADQRIVKVMLGLNSGSDGAATQLDLGNQFVPALTSAIDAELIAKGVDLEKRGAAAWDKVETGMLSKAGKSTKFVQMVSAMVDSALANYVPPN